MTTTLSSPRPTVALGVLRAVASVHLLAILAQPVFAGLFLTGDYDMLARHALGADAVFYLGLVQLVAAIVLAARGGRRWPVGACALLAAGETVQYVAGLAGRLGLHVPLGVVLVAGTVLTTIALWRPATGVAR